MSSTQNIIPVNILDATTYCAEAWSAVTETTIRNCWRKTGILPSDNETIDNDIIDSLGLEQPMSAGQYLSIDEEMDTNNINDEEIVSLLNFPSSNEEDEIEELLFTLPSASNQPTGIV